LGFTSNMISCGVRETIRFLVEHNMVSAIVTTAGGVEEDLIKCMKPTYLGSFKQNDVALRRAGINRIGNLLVPNDNYCAFEDWFTPLLDDAVREQTDSHRTWTPSSLIREMGRRIADPTSVLYWAAKHSIPIYCPALTDGSIGDMIFFHGFKNTPLVLDIVADLRALNLSAMKAPRSGSLILGGGLVKHHISNANLMRNGADYAVYINTGNEWEGSDAGADTGEAVSWGKIKMEATPVKVFGEATLIFPLLVAKTFAEEVIRRAAAPAKES